MIGRTNAESGSPYIVTATLASGASGETITATYGSKTKTATTDSNGSATFRNLSIGDPWTFSHGTDTATITVGIDNTVTL